MVYITLGHQDATRQAQAYMQSPMVQSVLNTGVDPDRVRNVIEKRLRDTGNGVTHTVSYKYNSVKNTVLNEVNYKLNASDSVQLFVLCNRLYIHETQLFFK